MAFLKALKKLQNENARRSRGIPKWVTRQRVQSMLILALALLSLFQIGQVSELQEKVAKMDVLEETSSNVLQEWSEGKDFLTNFGGDLNEIRKFLLLPTKVYDFGDLAEVNLAEEGLNLNTLLFTYVEQLGEYEENLARYEGNLSTFQTTLEENFWVESGLRVNSLGNFGEESVDFSFLDASDLELFKVSLAYDGFFSVDTYDGKLTLTDKNSAPVTVEDLKDFVREDLVLLKEKIVLVNNKRALLASVLLSSAVQEALTQENLMVGTELESSDRYYYQIVNSDHVSVAELTVSKKEGEITLQLRKPVLGYQNELSLVEADAESLLASVILDGIDSRSERQMLVEKNRSEVESIFKDRAFTAVLEELGLQFGAVVETDTRLAWPLLNSEGKTIRIIFIDKTTGEVKVEHPDGQDSQTISMALESFEVMGKKKLSTPFLV